MVLNESLVQERIYTRPASRAARGRALRGSRSAESAKVVDACCSFADAVDWRFSSPSPMGSAGDGMMSMQLTENEAALHAGSFIGLAIVPSKDALELRGGCFNMFYQPATVYEEFVSLSNLSAQALEKTLMDMHHRLEKYYRNYVKA